MGWRYVSYRDGSDSFSLPIEPMVKGADRVYVPNESSWLKVMPSWTSAQRLQALARLKSLAWNRKLVCGCPLSVGSVKVIRGSLKSTEGGQALEAQRLFEPGSKMTHEQAHQLWHAAARMFAAQAIEVFLNYCPHNEALGGLAGEWSVFVVAWASCSSPAFGFCRERWVKT